MNNDNIIILADKNTCTGCGVCVDVCPKSCITMVRDGLHDYPHIDTEKCIGCQKCLKTCPSINFLKKDNLECQNYYACWHKDLGAVKTSTSGGAGSALAEYAIDKGYYVAGVILSASGKIQHVIARSKEEILAFKGSKYVQSDSVGIFSECVNAIKQGHKVLFIGTPCQTEAMRRILPTNLHDKLLTCSIICHGVNSPYVWKDYRSSLEKKYHSHLVNYYFRCKSHGWQKKSGDSNLRVAYEISSGRKYDVPSWRNLFHYWFGQHYIMRSACFNCMYRTEERHSDIVIGDFWNVEKVQDGMDTFNGVSVLITTTSQGEEFIHTNPFLDIIPVDPKKTIHVLKGLVNKKSKETQCKELIKAETFATEYCQNGFAYMAKKYPCPSYIDQFINKIKTLI